MPSETQTRLRKLIQSFMSKWTANYALHIDPLHYMKLFAKWKAKKEPLKEIPVEVKKEFRTLALILKNKGLVKPSWKYSITGRIYCSEPNLQTIPLDSPFWQAVKNTFPTLYALDYRQAEIFALAALAKDEKLISDIQNKIDFYSFIHPDTPRDQAKALVFSFLYGEKPIPQILFDLYPTFANFVQELKKESQITTPLGITIETYNTTNYLAQAAIAECILLAMTLTKAYTPEPIIILPRHDELVANEYVFTKKAMQQASIILLGYKAPIRVKLL